MLYAGLDVHKNFCQAIVLTKDGEVVKEKRIKSEKEDIEEFFSGCTRNYTFPSSYPILCLTKDI